MQTSEESDPSNSHTPPAAPSEATRARSNFRPFGYSEGHIWGGHTRPTPHMLMFEANGLSWPWTEEHMPLLIGNAKRFHGQWDGAAKTWRFRNSSVRDEAYVAAMAVCAKHGWKYRLYESLAELEESDRKKRQRLEIGVCEITPTQMLYVFPATHEGSVAFQSAQLEGTPLRVENRVYAKGPATALKLLRSHDYEPKISNGLVSTLELSRDKWLLTVKATEEQAAALALTSGVTFRRSGSEFSASLANEAQITQALTELGLPHRIAAAEPPAIDLGSLENLPGWGHVAPNGYQLREHQKEAVHFFLAHDGRALIGDEMGTGKTAEAIACAGAVRAQRILVIGPAGVKRVWHSDILGWAGETPLLLSGRSAVITGAPRWVITSYEAVVKPSLRWVCDNAEADTLEAWLKSVGAGFVRSPSFGRRQWFDISRLAKGVVPDWLNAKDKKRWLAFSNSNERKTTLRSIRNWRPDLIIIDEAHRLKTPDAKRSKTVIELSRHVPRILLLTGTPVLNVAAEAINLVRAIHPQWAQHLANYADASAVKAMLPHLMIRRLVRDVLPNLPGISRRKVLIPCSPGPEYGELLNKLEAGECNGPSVAGVGPFGYGGDHPLAILNRMRHALGLAKAKSPDFLEYILELAIQKKGLGRGLIIFAHHHGVIDGLTTAIKESHHGLQVVSLDGRTSQDSTTATIEKFQTGAIDVLVAGTLAKGEGITLTRADTVVFVELEWVPAQMLQAEGRIRRIGQKADVCESVYICAEVDQMADDLDESMCRILARKMDEINLVLGEGESVLPPRTSESIVAEVLEALLARRRSRKSTGDQ